MLSFEPATAENLDVLLAWLFRQLPDVEREQRLIHCQALLEAGELVPELVVAARDRGVLRGVLVVLPLAGASALFWKPHAEDETVAAALVGEGLRRLRGRRVKIAQALLPPNEDGSAFLDNGFHHITQLQYLRHDLTLPDFEPPTARLTWSTYSEHSAEFESTLERTYQGTLDCPELNGRRTVAQILEGHRGAGAGRPDLWWLAWLEANPVGVVLLSDLGPGQGWDLSYLGLIPAVRGRGLATEMAYRSLEAAREAWVPQLLCALDARNEPAWQLYRKMGFSFTESRSVYLFFPASLDG